LGVGILQSHPCPSELGEVKLKISRLRLEMTGVHLTGSSMLTVLLTAPFPQGYPSLPRPLPLQRGGAPRGDQLSGPCCFLNRLFLWPLLRRLRRPLHRCLRRPQQCSLGRPRRCTRGRGCKKG